ncbi:hypothetical protein GQ457_12G002070 [Hibiscus cannabinus]
MDELIQLWIREGFLDGPNAHDLGAFTLDTLEFAYLLEIDESKQCIEMHDMIRHAALWLARDQGRKENNVLVSKGESLMDETLAKWGDAKWISLFDCISTNANLRSPSCPNLTTLILRDGQLQSFPEGLFDSMPALKVLDLSRNRWLTELPSNVGNVTTLHYINLSFTSLAELSVALGDLINLKNLESLIISDCESLSEVISEEIEFPRLKSISLTSMQNLKRIYPSPGCFPSLSEFRVYKCLLLSQIPFDMENANSLQKIVGEREWWDNLIWCHGAVKDICLMKFVSS